MQVQVKTRISWMFIKQEPVAIESLITKDIKWI